MVIENARIRFDAACPGIPEPGRCVINSDQVTDDVEMWTDDGRIFFCPRHRTAHYCQTGCANLMMPEGICRITLMPVQAGTTSEASDEEILNEYRQIHRVFGPLVVLPDQCSPNECREWFSFDKTTHMCMEHHCMHRCKPKKCPSVDGRCRISGIACEQARPRGKARRREAVDEVPAAVRCVFANGAWRTHCSRLWTNFIREFLSTIDIPLLRDNAFAIMNACQTTGMRVRDECILPVVPEGAISTSVSRVYACTHSHARKPRINRLTHAIKRIMMRIDSDPSVIPKLTTLGRRYFQKFS